MHPVATVYQFSIAVVTHFGYLAAVPQVVDILVRLVAVLADVPLDRVVAVMNQEHTFIKQP
ncbi:hypothetical protein L2164_13445 [Pectobacterium brasiliense]|uniref:hypothetical protein n=1 Tax=Pectobacterium TaxID=122277 RepID=UPI0005C63A18|nr:MULTISPECIES: hypothetical protein [Pectobacterium]MCG5049701.1 hypothetical protein [Pectobacterium brasiliense]